MAQGLPAIGEEVVDSSGDLITPKLQNGRSPSLIVGGRKGRFNFDLPPETGGTPSPRYAFDTDDGGRWYFQLERNLQGGRWEEAHHAADDYAKYRKMSPQELGEHLIEKWGDSGESGQIAAVIGNSAKQGLPFVAMKARLRAAGLNTHRQISNWIDEPPADGLPPIGSEVPDALPAATDATQGDERTFVDTATDVVKGAGAGVANTVFHGGDLIRRGLGMERVIDRPEVQAAITPPQTTAGKVGFAGEQIGEFFLPTGLVGKAGKVAEVAKAGALTLAQGGSPTAAGVSAGISAVVPGAKAATTVAGALETSARKSMAQALGATKEWAKAEAAKLAPQMLKRGIGGSREAMLATARETAKRVGGELNEAYRLAADAGETVPSLVIQGNVQLAADALKVADANGIRRVIPGTERVIEKLEELGEFAASLGDEIPVDKAAHIKRTWDKIVSKAGLFGPKATASATDSADAWAIREASGAFRELLNTNPTIAALNAETAFWTGLKNVLKETEKRTQAQRGGITDAIRGAGGAVAGAAMGGPVGAGLGQLATQQLSRILNSPAWKTRVSAPMKQTLADALASGSTGRIVSAASRIAASLPAQATANVRP